MQSQMDPGSCQHALMGCVAHRAPLSYLKWGDKAHSITHTCAG